MKNSTTFFEFSDECLWHFDEGCNWSLGHFVYYGPFFRYVRSIIWLWTLSSTRFLVHKHVISFHLLTHFQLISSIFNSFHCKEFFLLWLNLFLAILFDMDIIVLQIESFSTAFTDFLFYHKCMHATLFCLLDWVLITSVSEVANSWYLVVMAFHLYF